MATASPPIKGGPLPFDPHELAVAIGGAGDTEEGMLRTRKLCRGEELSQNVDNFHILEKVQAITDTVTSSFRTNYDGSPLNVEIAIAAKAELCDSTGTLSFRSYARLHGSMAGLSQEQDWRYNFI